MVFEAVLHDSAALCAPCFGPIVAQKSLRWLDVYCNVKGSFNIRRHGIELAP